MATPVALTKQREIGSHNAEDVFFEFANGREGNDYACVAYFSHFYHTLAAAIKNACEPKYVIVDHGFAVSVTDSEGLEAYRSQYISLVSGDK